MLVVRTETGLCQEVLSPIAPFLLQGLGFRCRVDHQNMSFYSVPSGFTRTKVVSARARTQAYPKP